MQVAEQKHPKHDHQICVEDALKLAEELCISRGQRFTDTRRRVLELVWQGHSAVKAYDIIDKFARDGSATKPPTVYRALDFLLEQGLVHRIESLNAYVGCAHPEEGHTSQFLICDNCETVVELETPRLKKALKEAADKAGFSINQQTVELHGICPHCRAAA